MKIHHLGVVVADLDQALALLGLDRSAVTETAYDPVQKNNLHFVRLPENDLWLEFVEPTSETASTYTFAKKYGIGLHHLGMASDDLAQSERAYTPIRGAFVLGRYGINLKSFGDVRTLFIGFRGLILEFVQRVR